MSEIVGMSIDKFHRLQEESRRQQDIEDARKRDELKAEIEGLTAKLSDRQHRVELFEKFAVAIAEQRVFPDDDMVRRADMYAVMHDARELMEAAMEEITKINGDAK